MPYGSSIVVKLIAYNNYGDSEESDPGNGAVILTYPDAPVNVAEVYSERAATSLGLSWDKGASNGGSAILDYTVSYVQGDDNYQKLKSGILLEQYTAISLTAGVTYRFKIQARNEFGLSPYSEAIQLLCAFKPAVALAPVTTVEANNVIVSWQAPDTNGSPILSYRIKIQQSDSVYSEDLTNCDGQSPTIVTNLRCTIPLLTLEATPWDL